MWYSWQRSSYLDVQSSLDQIQWQPWQLGTYFKVLSKILRNGLTWGSAKIPRSSTISMNSRNTLRKITMSIASVLMQNCKMMRPFSLHWPKNYLSSVKNDSFRLLHHSEWNILLNIRAETWKLDIFQEFHHTQRGVHLPQPPWSLGVVHKGTYVEKIAKSDFNSKREICSKIK